MSWLSRLFFALFVFFTGIGVSYADLPTSYYQDITCPPMPAQDPNCTGTPKCPPGYALSPSYSIANYHSTGIFVCSPLESGLSADKYRRCVYRNPACYTVKSSYKASTEYYERKINEALSLAPGGETYAQRLARIAALDPEIINQLESSTSSAVDSSFFLFVVEALKNFYDALFESSLYFVALGSLWLFSLGVGSIFLKELQGSTPRLFFIRLAALGTLLWVPVPHTAGGTNYWQPLFWDAVRTAVYIGNDLAEEAGRVMNTTFFSTAFFKISTEVEDAMDLLEKRARDTYKEIKAAEKDLKACFEIYSIADFLSVPSLDDIPDADAEKARALGTANKGNPAYYSKLKCVEIEKHYKELVSRYNSIAVSYHNARGIRNTFEGRTPITDVIAHPERYTGSSDEGIRAIAGVAAAAKKLGWVSFPLITLPVARLSLSFSPSAVMGENFSEPNALIRALGLLSLPPGNWIAKLFLDANDKVMGMVSSAMGAAGAAGGFAVGGPIGAAVGSALGKFAAWVAGKVSGGYSLYIAYKFTSAVLNALPIVILVGVFVVRYVMWLLDVLKLMMASPFLFLHAFSMRNYHEAYMGIRGVVVAALFPLILLVSALFAFVGVEMAKFLVWDLGVKTLDIVDAVKGSIPWKITVKWPLEGFIYWASVMVQSLMAYKLMMGTPEWFLQKMRLHEAQGAPLAEHIFEGVFRRGLPV
jgi:hypothetical protein